MLIIRLVVGRRVENVAEPKFCCQIKLNGKCLPNNVNLSLGMHNGAKELLGIVFDLVLNVYGIDSHCF